MSRAKLAKGLFGFVAVVASLAVLQWVGPLI